MEIKHFHTLAMVQPAEILQNRVFTEENTTSSLREKFFSLLSLGIQATDPSEGNR
jgi:hypothetical protein